MIRTVLRPLPPRAWPFVLALLALAPLSAEAGTPSAATSPSVESATVRVDNDTLVYRGSSGQRDQIRYQSPHWIALGTNIAPGAGCTAQQDAFFGKPGVVCDATTNVDVELGDYGRNEFLFEVHNGRKLNRVAVTGGAKSDQIDVIAPGATTTVDGGAGD